MAVEDIHGLEVISPRLRFCCDQVLVGSEICAGTGMLSRVLQLHGLNIPAMDIIYWKNHITTRPLMNNPLDLLGNAGFVHRGYIHEMLLIKYAAG